MRSNHPSLNSSVSTQGCRGMVPSLNEYRSYNGNEHNWRREEGKTPEGTNKNILYIQGIKNIFPNVL